jgi:predicted MFS family arabinose efflux permease
MSENSKNNEELGQSLPKSVWVIFLASLTTSMGITLISPVLPLIEHSFNSNPMEISLLYTSYNVMIAISMIITGFVSSRLSIKYTLIIGILIIGLFSIISGFATDIWTIIWFRGICGIGDALFFATGFAAIILLSKNMSTKAIILYESGFGIGASIGPFIGGILGETSWRYPFFGVGILMIVVLVLIILFVPNVKEKEYHKKISMKETFEGLLHRPIIVLGSVACIYEYGLYSIILYTPLIINLQPIILGVVFLIGGISLAFSSYFISPLCINKLGSLKSLCLTFACFSIVFLVMSIFIKESLIIGICTIIASILMGCINSLLSTTLAETSQMRESTTSATYHFIFYSGGAITPFLANTIGQSISSNAPFIVGIFIFILPILIILLNKSYLNSKEIIN